MGRMGDESIFWWGKEIFNLHKEGEFVKTESEKDYEMERKYSGKLFDQSLRILADL